MQRGIVFFFFAAFAIGACNIPRMVEQHQRRKWDRKGLVQHFTEDTTAIRSSYVLRTGERPLIVFLHGYGASGLIQYYQTGLLLRKDYDLLFPDLLRCGGSVDRSGDPGLYRQVDHLEALLDALGEDRSFVLVGNSYGGIVASRFAARHPDRVQKLVLYDSPAFCYTSQQARHLADSLDAAGFEQLITPANIPDFKKSLDLVYHDRPWIPRFLLRQVISNTPQSFRDQQMQLLTHLFEEEHFYLEEELHFPMPVYLLWGDHDRLIPLSTARCLAEKLSVPSSRFIVFPNAAHAANMEYPEDFAAVIDRIMKE